MNKISITFLLLLILTSFISCSNSITLSKIDFIKNIELKQKCYPNCQYKFVWKSTNNTSIKFYEYQPGVTATLFNYNKKLIGNIFTDSIYIKSDSIIGYYPSRSVLNKRFCINSISYVNINPASNFKDIFIISSGSIVLVLLGVIFLNMGTY